MLDGYPPCPDCRHEHHSPFRCYVVIEWAWLVGPGGEYEPFAVACYCGDAKHVPAPDLPGDPPF